MYESNGDDNQSPQGFYFGGQVTCRTCASCDNAKQERSRIPGAREGNGPLGGSCSMYLSLLINKCSEGPPFSPHAVIRSLQVTLDVIEMEK